MRLTQCLKFHRPTQSFHCSAPTIPSFILQDLDLAQEEINSLRRDDVGDVSMVSHRSSSLPLLPGPASPMSKSASASNMHSSAPSPRHFSVLEAADAEVPFLMDDS